MSMEELNNKIYTCAKQLSSLTPYSFNDWSDALWSMWSRYGVVAINEMVNNPDDALVIFSSWSVKMWLERYENNPMTFEK